MSSAGLLASRSVKIARNSGDRYREAEALGELGSVLADHGQRDAGRGRLAEGLAIFEELAVPEAATVRARLESI